MGDDAHRDGDDTTAVGEKKQRRRAEGAHGDLPRVPPTRQGFPPGSPREHLRKCAPGRGVRRREGSVARRPRGRGGGARGDAARGRQRLSFGTVGRARKWRMGLGPSRSSSIDAAARRKPPRRRGPHAARRDPRGRRRAGGEQTPGLRFHPVHRFEGNSLLSRIGHVRRAGRGRRQCGRGRGWRSFGARPARGSQAGHGHQRRVRLVKRPELVDGFARQFRGDAGEHRAVKEYLAIGVGALETSVTGCVVKANWKPPEASGNEQTAAAEFIGLEFTVDAHVGPHASIPEARAVHASPPTLRTDSKETDQAATTVLKLRAYGHPDRLVLARDDRRERRR